LFVKKAIQVFKGNKGELNRKNSSYKPSDILAKYFAHPLRKGLDIQPAEPWAEPE
jgi:hypothetical protein